MLGLFFGGRAGGSRWNVSAAVLVVWVIAPSGLQLVALWTGWD